MYAMVATQYHICTAIYLGSYIDVTPSLFIPKLTYVGSAER